MSIWERQCQLAKYKLCERRDHFYCLASSVIPSPPLSKPPPGLYSETCWCKYSSLSCRILSYPINFVMVSGPNYDLTCPRCLLSPPSQRSDTVFNHPADDLDTFNVAVLPLINLCHPTGWAPSLHRIHRSDWQTCDRCAYCKCTTACAWVPCDLLWLCTCSRWPSSRLWLIYLCVFHSCRHAQDVPSTSSYETFYQLKPRTCRLLHFCCRRTFL